MQDLPQVLKYISYDFFKENTDGYFIRINIIILNKHLGFPLTSKLNEDGARDVTNDMENEIAYVDKVGLEELITFHEAEFETLDGYYFNSVGDDKINDVIKDFYDPRKKLKRNKNPAQMLIRLLMNSMYGKRYNYQGYQRRF